LFTELPWRPLSMHTTPIYINLKITITITPTKG
jgi:hypothetical protein